MFFAVYKRYGTTFARQLWTRKANNILEASRSKPENQPSLFFLCFSLLLFLIDFRIIYLRQVIVLSTPLLHLGFSSHLCSLTSFYSNGSMSTLSLRAGTPFFQESFFWLTYSNWLSLYPVVPLVYSNWLPF